MIIFTNNAILGLAAKPTRGFAANLRVMADKTNDQLTITNPLYLQSAFLQEGYNKIAAQKILEDLKKAFPNSINSDDKLGVGNIADYHFMVSMPYYEDMMAVGSGANEELLAKLKAKKVVTFEQKLVNGSTLVGIKLSNRTTKFASKIGSQNAALLPYAILIENNKAYILHPKYYIALMYPLLDMGTFMTIATAPGAIENEIKGMLI